MSRSGRTLAFSAVLLSMPTLVLAQAPREFGQVCTAADARVPSADAATARVRGCCSGFITNLAPIDDPADRCMLSAGHCQLTGGESVEFEPVPASLMCEPQPPPPAKVFVVDPAHVASVDFGQGTGEDFAVFRSRRNAVTGLTVFQEQGAQFTLAGGAVPTDPVGKYGYGQVGSPFGSEPATFDLGPCECRVGDPVAPLSQTQTEGAGTVTGVGLGLFGNFMTYSVQTCSADSGAPIFPAADDTRALAIHTDGRCVQPPPGAVGVPANGGTAVTNPNLIAKLASLCPVMVNADHYLCYTARDTLVPPQIPTIPLNLIDQFQHATYRASRAKLFCTPADKNGTGIVDPDTHLKRYKIRRVAGQHLQPVVRIANQFGSLTLHVRNESDLMVPTAKSLVAPPPPPDPLRRGYEHYKCYRANVVGPKLPRGIIVESRDQFGFSKFELRRPRRLCTPVSKNGEGIHDALRHLVCYGLRPVEAVRPPDVHVTNQFGVERLRLGREKEFCVPSLKFPVTPPPECGNGVREAGEQCDPPDFQDGCAMDEVCNAQCRCQKLDDLCKDPTPVPASHKGLMRPLQGGWDAFNGFVAKCAPGDLNAGKPCKPPGPGGGCDSVVEGDNLGTCLKGTGYGTLGSFPRLDANKFMVLLSNNHVFARQSGNIELLPAGNAVAGEPINQPNNPPVLAGSLLDYEWFCFDGGGDCAPGPNPFNQVNRVGQNCIDAGIGETSPGVSILDSGDILDVGVPATYMPPLAPPGQCASSLADGLHGRIVKKSGATTGFTCGQVVDENVMFNIEYSGRTAKFIRQFKVKPLTLPDPAGGFVGAFRGKHFSCPGDSGSLIVGVTTNKPLGLLFAGTQGVQCLDTEPPSETDANYIDIVLRRFRAHF